MPSFHILCLNIVLSVFSYSVPAEGWRALCLEISRKIWKDRLYFWRGNFCKNNTCDSWKNRERTV